MTYYKPQNYAERYVVYFDDVTGTEWKISIQSPNFSGQPTTLTGAEFPVEWMGVGDEAQDEVVLGSTGTIRLLCKNATERDSIYKIGQLLPSVINDRRVQVCRKMNGDWSIYFQGFIVPQTFSQDWDSTPYEIELPIVSTVAAMEHFTMPLPGSACYADFESVTSIANLLRRIFGWCGCDIRDILTNKPIYQDFNGNTPYDTLSRPRHWSQGFVNIFYFYDMDSSTLRPKTFKEVLETICFPYGKVQDYAKSVAITMRWKSRQSPNSQLHTLAVWDNYNAGTFASTLRFATDKVTPAFNISDIDTAGTDNKTSVIVGPKSARFSSGVRYNTTIFEMSDALIKTNFDPTNGEKDVMEWTDRSSRYIFALDDTDVNKDIFKDYQFIANGASDCHPFCRVMDAKVPENSGTFTTSIIMPLGFAFTLRGETLASIITSFTIPVGVRSTLYTTDLKLTLKAYKFEDEEMTVGGDGSYINMALCIQDLEASSIDPTTHIPQNRFYVWDDSTGGLTWKTSSNSIEWIQPQILSLRMNSDGFILRFNEDRGDWRDPGTDLHHLRISIGAFSDASSQPIQQLQVARMFANLKLEYVPYNRVEWISPDGVARLPLSSLYEQVSKDVSPRAEMLNPNGGDGDLSLEMKTRCGLTYKDSVGGRIVPFNSFCDAPSYIDMGQREMIELSDVEFERFYYSSYYFDPVTLYSLVLDGDKVYIPVAVGMNPRMNTMRLRLISSNVTAN